LSIALLVAATLSVAVPAMAQGESPITLTPVAYKTEKGRDGGQPVSALQVMDQSGSDDDWDSYVEFQTPGKKKYRGYRTYELPSEIDPGDITAIQVQANYKGPRKNDQKWTWTIYNWKRKKWETIGDNAAAGDWTWTLLTFDVNGDFNNYVKKGDIRVRVASGDKSDDADLDYEALLISTAGSIPPPDPPPPDPDPDPDPDPTPDGIWQPTPGTSWQWQLTGTIDTSYDVDMYDIDLFEAPQSVIDALHADGRVVICYFSAGSWEDWRPDAGDFPGAVLGDGNGWPGEKWLDIRQLDVLGPIMEARLDLAVQKNCDGVEPDNVDGYANDSGFPLTYQDQLTFNLWLADAAHARGLSIGLKNDLDQVPDLVDAYDWALNEQCFQYKECETLLPFVEANKAVFGVEYTGKKKKICKKANKMDFDWLMKKQDLGAWRKACR